MRLSSWQNIVSATLAFAVFSVVCLAAAASAGQQDSQTIQQQQRPRKVGSTQTSNSNSQASGQQTNSCGEEVGEGDVLRVEPQLVSVPAVLTDKAAPPLTGLRPNNSSVM